MESIEKFVFDLFKGKEIFLVGGCARDRLLERKQESEDLDFATKCRPDEVCKVINDIAGYKAHTIGKAFGTISFIPTGYENKKVEITTYRKNEKYTKNNRRPVVEWGNSIEEDLQRRDFTINAIAIDREGNVIDPFEGEKDLRKGIIKTPLNPEETFADDPLRILRAVRFRNRFDFFYSPAVKKALLTESHKVLNLSRERILEEMNKILFLEHCDVALDDMMEFEIINYIIPELTILNEVGQNSKYDCKNVWEHTIQVVKKVSNDLCTKWASLLHDIGKPYTMSILTGETHFYRHEEVSALMSEGILKRFGLSNKQIQEIIFLVKNHMHPNLYDNKWGDSAVRRFVRKSGVLLQKIFELSEADITSHKLDVVSKGLARIKELMGRCKQSEQFKDVKCPLNGLEIMRYYKLHSSPVIGQIKNIIIEAVLNGQLPLKTINKQIYFDYVDKRKDNLIQKQKEV